MLGVGGGGGRRDSVLEGGRRMELKESLMTRRLMPRLFPMT